MKFNDLYNRVFIQEQDEQPSEVANPEDFNVDPAPVPEAPVTQPEETPSVIDTGAADELDTYIAQAVELSNKLVSNDGSDLLTLLSKLNSSRPGDQFHNVYRTLDANVTKAADALSDLAGQLLVFKNAPTH